MLPDAAGPHMVGGGASGSGDEHAQAWRLARGSLGSAALLAATAPLLVLAALIAFRRPQLALSGDEATTQLAVVNAAHHAQLLGAASRFGWHHPGPSWFYVLDVGFLPFGSHSWSLIAAVVLLHAVFVAAIVAVAWRWRGPVAAVLTALLLLAFLHLLGPDILLDPLAAFAVVLPMALLLVLAAATAEGSATAFAALLVVGSFAMQTHMSTAPAVAVVVIVAGVLALVEMRRQHNDVVTYILAPQKPKLRERLGVYGGAVLGLLLALMWTPPAIQQINDRPGNIRDIVDFIRSSPGDNSLIDGITAVGRDVQAFPFGSYDADLASHLGSHRVGAVAALAIFLGLCALLFDLASRSGDRFAHGIAVTCIAATLAAVFSVTRITGPVDAHLLTWVTTLPLALGVGYASLLAAPGRLAALAARADRGAQTWRVAEPALVAVAVVVTATITAAQVDAYAGGDAHDVTVASAQRVQDAVSAAVAAAPAGTVFVRPDPAPAWPVATGITLRLVADGRSVEVPDRWLPVWGDQFRTRDPHPRVVVVVALASPSPPAGVPAGARPAVAGDGVEVYVVVG